jgi:hypothetical protein
LFVENVPQSRLLVYVHATDGAALLGATLNGKPALVGASVESGHPVFVEDIALDPGVPQVMKLHLQEPVVAGRAGTMIQPMARPQHTTLDVPTCS